MIRIVLISLALFLQLDSIAQSSHGFNSTNSITDFYEYANNDWLKSTKLDSNAIVINNWGILWSKIMAKSLRILNDTSLYNLNNYDSNTLTQIRNYYNSCSSKLTTDNKRVYEIHEQFPFAFGHLFSEITLSDRKLSFLKIVIDNIKTCYQAEIKNSNKLNEFYKELFLAKLESMTFELGSPSLNDYPQIPQFSANAMEANQKLFKKYKKACLKYKSDWRTPPFETDCFYDIIENKVKIYAGIIFDSYEKDTTNLAYYYATIGRTIAHEIAHAFDNIGKNYNQFGKEIKNKNEDIWEPTYMRLISQYNQYTIQDSIKVDGKKTMQENFADLAGVAISIKALQKHISFSEPTISKKETNNILRSFFIEYAKFWREKATPEFEQAAIKRIHTPQKFRAIGPVYNQNRFYELFPVDADSEYFIYESERINIF